MTYYPLSKIKTNLYTDGGEFSLTKPLISSPQVSYVGFYYKTSNGKKYTGKNPQDGPNRILYDLLATENPPVSPNIVGQTVYIFFDNVDNDPLTNEYTKLAQTNNIKSRNLPVYNPVLPTDKDKDLGVFNRYFCKKTNELLYIEIDKETFNLLKYQDSKIAWDLYTPLSILWQIKGDKEKTYIANKNNISILEQRNKWYGFSKYLKEDYLKYYLGS